MALPSPTKADQNSPNLFPRKPSREALELLKHSPSIIKDATPPHQNTRSKRNRQKAIPTRTSPNENAPTGKENVDMPQQVREEGSTEETVTPQTPPAEGGKSPPHEESPDKETTPDIDLHLESVPPTPALNTARIETPLIDCTPRALRRKPFQERKMQQRDWGTFTKDGDLLDHYTNFEIDALQSTEMNTVLAQEEISHAKPPRWSLRQLSPIRNIEDKKCDVEQNEDEEHGDEDDLPCSYGETLSFRVQDAAVQVSMCPKCSTHNAWSEMKPIVMVFTLLMLSLLYRGLLRVDPRLSQDFGNALGLAVQGTFLASFNLEDYIANIFSI